MPAKLILTFIAALLTLSACETAQGKCDFYKACEEETQEEQ